jgi:ATP-binding cassette, subfamily B, bacterial
MIVPQKKLQKSDRKKSVFALLGHYKRIIILLILLALLSNGINLIIPKIISHGIDSFTGGHYLLKSILIEFLSATFLIFLLTYLQSVVQTYASERVARDIRTQLTAKISRQSFSYIQRTNPSKLLTNLTSDVDSVKMFVSQALVTLASSVFVIIGASILLLTINWRLALTVIAILPIISTTFFIVFRKVKVLFKRSREVIDWLNKVLNESILGAAIIRVLNAQQTEYSKFLSANTEAKSLGLSILNLFATLIPIITFVANLSALTILALGGHFVITGSMSLGNFAAFNSYLSLLIFPIIVIGFISNLIAQASASYQRIGDVLEAPEIKETGEITTSLSGNIEIKNVTLKYGDKPVLKNVSLSIRGGSQTAILGPTAAGKSQLLYLITGLNKPDLGSIEFDGIPLDKYVKESFHNQIGFVFQDSIMFNLSLRENIAFNVKVSDEALEKAIDTAELKDFIDTLPQGMDTLVSERGTSLSGGQKQRIMLARALALNPSILLLDDFTARVDRKTEQKILCNIMNNYPEITLISVTQKISSVKNYDQIILLMEGEIVAKGKHRDLLETCPEYAQIHASQRSTSHYEL